MAKFDRYLMSQLLVLFGFFSLVLVLVYWINRAVVLFDQLIANGHSALVFLEFTALSLPNVIRLVLPMAAFAATVYVTNRLSSESELVVVQATGYSPFRLARPVLVFGIVVALLLSALTHVLVPASLRQLAVRSAEVDQSLTSRFLREGTFQHPAEGITFYVREIDADGVLLDIYLSDATAEDRRSEYSARRALFVRDDTGPKLIMLDGMAQDLRISSRSLSVTTFEDFVYDVSPFTQAAQSRRTPANQRSTAQLLWPEPAAKGGKKAIPTAVLLREGHWRISQALLCIVSALIGFSTLMLGGFSRFGLWKQIAGAILLLLILKSLDNYMNDLARNDATLWPLIYLGTVLGLVLSYGMLWLAAHPHLFAPRPKAVPA